MKYLALILTFAASPLFASAPEFTLGFGRADYSSKAKVEGIESDTTKRTLFAGYLSGYLPASDIFGLSLVLSTGSSNSSENYSDRAVKLLPKFKIWEGGIWALAGVGQHDMRQLGTNHGVTTGIAGLAFTPKLGIEGFSYNFQLLYEQSLAAENYSIGETKITNYKFRSFETSLGLSYSL